MNFWERIFQGTGQTEGEGVLRRNELRHLTENKGASAPGVQ